MKIASFNIENLFARHRDLLFPNVDNKESLILEFDALVYKRTKSDSDYARMRELWDRMETYNGKRERLKAFAEYELYLLSNSRFLRDRPELARLGHRVMEHPKLRLLPLDDVQGKADRIKEVDADVLMLQEVESWEALQLFNAHFLDGMYQEIHFGPTGDAMGRGMGLLLRHGVRLGSLGSISGPPLPSGGACARGYLQEYRLESGSLGSFGLLNVFLPPNRRDGWASFSDAEMGLLAGLVRPCFSNPKVPTFLAGSLHIPNYSTGLKNLMEDLGLVGISELDRRSKKHNGLYDGGYVPMGGLGNGIPIKQRDYLMVPKAFCGIFKSAGIELSATRLSSPWQRKRNDCGIENDNNKPIYWLRF